MSDIEKEVEQLRQRVERLESQMAFLQRSLGTTSEEPPGWRASEKVIDLLRRGDKTSAIRAFREETGASLKDAKVFVESLHLE